MPFNENDVPFAHREPRAFASAEDRQAAFVDPRYSTSSDFRNWVHRCVAISGGAADMPVHDSSRVQRVVISHDESMLAQEAVTLTEQLKRGKDQYAQMLRDTGHDEMQIQDELNKFDQESADHAARQAEFERSPLKHLMILDSTPKTPARTVKPEPFLTLKEQTAAMTDPRYRDQGPTGEAFRSHIAERLGVTDLGIKTSGTLGPNHQGSATEL